MASFSDDVDVLLCGGTGELGGRIASRLRERDISFRALVRPTSEVARLQTVAAELCLGDLTNRESLDQAMRGIRTVITTVNSFGAALAGNRSSTVEAVDVRGNENLIGAAEAAGVERFVFVSAAGLSELMVELAPLLAAKLKTEQALIDSRVRAVLVRPGPFQETWCSARAGIRPDKGWAIVFGRGRSPSSDVSMDDVAEACVRLASMADPPQRIELGGPETLTRHQVVDVFERTFGGRFRRIAVPRSLLRLGAVGLRRWRPELASLFGIALVRDIEGEKVSPEPLRGLGVEPRSTSDYIRQMAQAAPEPDGRAQRAFTPGRRRLPLE